MKRKREKRTFEATDSGRPIMSILFGLAAPSSGGKTLSAIRVATGIERGLGATSAEDFRRRIQVIDTESKRALQYRRDASNDGYEFSHISMSAPFSPLDYLDAIELAVERGGRTIIIDQLTYEHEGQGGVLEMHVEETERLARAWYSIKPTEEPKAWQLEKTQFSGWGTPKGERRQLLNAITTRWGAGMNFILCFRAKPKARPAAKGDKDEKGREAKGIVGLGFQPLGAGEYLYEMSARALLPPNAAGVPVWSSDEPNGKTVFKLPRHFEHIFLPPHQLCEEDGEKMARWALGVHAAKPERKNIPTFSAKLEWAGKAEWAGKPLAEAPPETLTAYADAITLAMEGADNPTKKKMTAALAAVRKAQGGAT